MPKESFCGGNNEYRASMDIFQTGATMTHMLSGVRPWAGYDRNTIKSKVRLRRMISFTPVYINQLHPREDNRCPGPQSKPAPKYNIAFIVASNDLTSGTSGPLTPEKRKIIKKNK